MIINDNNKQTINNEYSLLNIKINHEQLKKEWTIQLKIFFSKY